MITIPSWNNKGRSAEEMSELELLAVEGESHKELSIIDAASETLEDNPFVCLRYANGERFKEPVNESFLHTLQNFGKNAKPQAHHTGNINHLLTGLPVYHYTMSSETLVSVEPPLQQYNPIIRNESAATDLSRTHASEEPVINLQEQPKVELENALVEQRPVEQLEYRLMQNYVEKDPFDDPFGFGYKICIQDKHSFSLGGQYTRSPPGEEPFTYLFESDTYWKSRSRFVRFARLLSAIKHQDSYQPDFQGLPVVCGYDSEGGLQAIGVDGTLSILYRQAGLDFSYQLERLGGGGADE